ncbi:MAG TPA: hypothetical protein VK401_01085 [Propionibacteriaceae bacterium]|jgi:hypothetical protein|nr:hypothetical protein [Propionibacteriaceae bacterium]
MTIVSTKERPAQQPNPAEELGPEVAVAAPPAGGEPPLPTTSVADSGRIAVEAEEPEPVGARTEWMTRFAWARTVGGW